MRRIPVVLGLVLAGALLIMGTRTPGGSRSTPATTVSAWSQLDPQARCDSAVSLVSHPQRWPLLCRWRNPGEQLAGQSYPPPPGPPPYEDPHVEIYVSPTQTREGLARVIAHEFGHMHHTREPTFVPEYLAARNLDPQTPPEVWTEDYAEVFAALFGPPSTEWRAPTPRPSPEALAALRSQFFS